MSKLANRYSEISAKNPILEGREKIESSDVVRLYGKNGFTVIEISRVDIIDKNTGDPKHYYYLRIKEDDTIIITSGMVLTRIIDSLVDDFGSVEEINNILPDDDFVLIPSMKKSKNGNKYVDFVVA